MMEKILCAAIKLDDIIICGYRHDRCVKIIQAINSDIKVTQKMQGFMTSRERFVSRKKGGERRRGL